MPAGGAGYPKSRRLLRAREFRAVLERARRLRSAGFTVSYADNGLGYPRLGVTVSRRVASRATARNRIKRIAREAFRAFQDRLPAADIVVLAAKPAAEDGNQALRRDLDQLFERMGSGYACARTGR